MGTIGLEYSEIVGLEATSERDATRIAEAIFRGKWAYFRLEDEKSMTGALFVIVDLYSLTKVGAASTGGARYCISVEKFGSYCMHLDWRDVYPGYIREKIFIGEPKSGSLWVENVAKFLTEVSKELRRLSDEELPF